MNLCFWKYFPFLLHILTCFPTIITTCQAAVVFKSCMESSGSYTENSPHETNLKALLTSLPLGLNNYGFNSSSFGLTPNTVYAISLCRGDVEIHRCRNCVWSATGELPLICPNSKNAVVWYNYCMLRYSNESISGKYTWRLPTFYGHNVYNASSKDQFNEALKTLLSGLRKSASNGGDHKKFATNQDAQTIYGLMQCTPNLSMQDCNSCLNYSANLATSSECNGKIGCRVMNPSCYMRYDVYQFFNDITSAPAPPPSNSSTRKGWIWIVIVVVISVVGIIPTIIGYIMMKKWRREKEEKQWQREYLKELITSDSLKITSDDEEDGAEGHELKILSFSLIVEATNNFSNENKLGEGGFGPVYKGKLLDGREIAIKRLSRMSGQGLVEFKNELILIAKLQHTNLVRVLGCCIHGEEKMLIYEYMPNKSLDFHLFDPAKKELLNWPIRMNIIEGVAQGLLYLHKYSRMRVIHRDLKASNVLLDGSMNPKISDFGMARVFKQNETEAVTKRVVGTYGYMSPEYAMKGTFSVKSDVFSFGVLILEIVSGRRNTSFCNFNECQLNLIGYAWELWKERAMLALKDSTLGDSFVENELVRIVHVGLLCVQEDATDRPTMSDVVLMLTNESLALPSPKKPAFFNGRNTLNSSTSKKDSPKDCSLNYLTVTEVAR